MDMDLWYWTMARISIPNQPHTTIRPTKTQSKSTAPPPPLLALPLELKNQIIAYLSDTEDPWDPEPTLIILRRTHRVFRDIIPSAPYSSPDLHGFIFRRSKNAKLLQAERKYPSLIPPKMLPCYGCQLVLDRSAFKEWDSLTSRGHLCWGLGDYGHMGVIPGEPIISLGPRLPGTRKCGRCLDAEFG